MNEFERKIQKLPWRNAPGDLKERIFGDATESRSLVPPTPKRRGQKISIKLSLALATAAGFLGFIAGTMQTMSDTAATAATVARVGVDIRVIETSHSRNSFDFSDDAIQILPGEFKAYIDREAESSP